MDWLKQLDKRQRQEVAFAIEYAKKFSHGTDGHNRLLLIAKMAELLDEYSKPAFSGVGQKVAEKESGNE